MQDPSFVGKVFKNLCQIHGGKAKLEYSFGLIAQWIEHPPSKRVVAGSNPAQSVASWDGMKNRLGEFEVLKKSFSNLDAVIQSFQNPEFSKQTSRKKSDQINEMLLELIQKESEPCFLLAPVLEFIERVEAEKILSHYSLNRFELWLNQYSGLSFEENYRIRAKIVGKFVERNDYQHFFPIGMGKVYDGTHFVTAHKSPDLDTTIASFWGWMDAFGARVSKGLHVWNLPGGPPASQIEIDLVFRQIFGNGVFTHLPKTRTALNLTGKDLLTQKGMVQEGLDGAISEIDHERQNKSIVLVDEKGLYLGDWRNIDVEEVRNVIWHLSSSLRWFENSLHLHLIALFAKKELSLKEIESSLKPLFTLKIGECEPAKELLKKQKSQVEKFLQSVLKIPGGIGCTFEEFGIRMNQLQIESFQTFDEMVATMKLKKLFDQNGILIEERPRIFSFLEEAVKKLHIALLAIRNRLEKMDIAMAVKSNVFGIEPKYVTLRDELEEIRSKMGGYSYLTVNDVIHESRIPMGIVLAEDIRKNVLGTVSLRDFCNREEMGIPPYLDVISVIDHHKTSLQTVAPPFAIISDAQSCNTLVAKQAFLLNDRYSLLGMNAEKIQTQLKESISSLGPLTNQLLQKSQIAKRKNPFYIHPDREFTEYLHFLYAILDDTDLLSKVSLVDIEVIVELLNRMKTIVSGKMSIVIDLDDLPRDQHFLKNATQRILQNEEMFSLYRKVYEYREKEVERNIQLAAENKLSNIFADTKEQNGRCRIGQTKVFAINIPYYQKHAEQIRSGWIEKAQDIYQKNADIALHMHMVSTIVSAEEVFQGKTSAYSHKDELWIWIPMSEMSIELLKRFLNAFQASPGLKQSFEQKTLEVEIPNEEYAAIFKESFPSIPQKTSKSKLPIAILRFNPSALNSRKAMVSPFLPTM